MDLGIDYIVRYLSDISGAVKGAKELENINNTVAKNIQAKYGQVTKVIGQVPTSIKQSTIKGIDGNQLKTLETTGQVVQTVNGNFLELSKTTTRVGNDMQITSSSVKDVTNQFVKTNIETAKAGKFFSDLGDNLKQLIGRALLTIPVWIALRGAMTGFFGGIQDGIKNLIAFDLALQKIRNNLSGTTQEVATSFNKIRTSITEASKATGISTEEIAGAVKQFATLGFSANESLQGALGATKLSIALFGDASDTAGAFARALNILIDRSAGAKSAVDQMNDAFALTSQLEQTNDFEIKNVTEALDKFAGTAAGVGLTMNQTLQILAALGTAGRRGSEGATLLSTSFNQLLSNIPKISKSLGLVVGAGESTFTIFTKILNKIVELNNTPGGQSAAVKSIGDIFGGARGIKIVQSLVAVKDILDANIATLPSFTALNEKVARTLDTESGQAKVLGNNLKEMGKSFVTALAGSENFTQAIVSLNNAVKGLSEGLKPLGSTIHAIFSNLGVIAGASFLLRFQRVLTVQAIASTFLASTAAVESAGVVLSVAFRNGFLRGFAFLGKLIFGSLISSFAAISVGGVGGVLAAIVAGIFSPITITVGLIGKLVADSFTENFVKGIEAKSAKAQLAFTKLIDGLKGNLATQDLILLINDLTIKQKSGDAAGIRAIAALRIKLQEQMDKAAIKVEVPIEVTPLVSFQEQQDIAKLLLKDRLDELKLQGASNVELAKAKILGTAQLDIKEDTIKLLENELDLERAIQEEKQSLSKFLLDKKLEELKSEGATNVQLAKAKILGIEQLNIKENTLSLLANQLALEKAIHEEKRLQNKLGSDSIKLFDIAQTEGVDVAKAIGDVLAGNIDFSDFMQRGGRQIEVFKKEFADLFKQQQAFQFFTGERVTEAPNLQRGSSIAIQEEALRKSKTGFNVRDRLNMETATATVDRLLNVQATLPITINNNIDIAKLNEVKESFIKEITKQLPKIGSDINNALNEALNGKQGNNL